MRPFLSFYGAKWRSAGRYDAPAYPVVVEPFAGSAGYSVYHDVERVILIDRDPVVVAVWKYLIAVSPEEMLALPDVGPDTHIEELDVCSEARHLIGFWLGRGVTHPARKPAKWNREILSGEKWQDSRSATWGPELRARLAEQVQRIRKWEVLEGSYEQAPEIYATWFIDPPYSRAGHKYRVHHEIDRAHLGDWCRSRGGQVIVCDGPGPRWLPFTPMHLARGSQGYARERVWTNGVRCAP